MDASNPLFALEIATATSFVLLAGAFWIVSSLGQWAIAPVERTTFGLLSRRVRTRFSLGELGLLLAQVQLAAGACLWITASDLRWGMPGCALASCGIVAAWWASARRLTICRVNCRRRRATFLGVVAPLTCVAIACGLWFNGRAVFEVVATGDFVMLPWLAGNLAALVAFLLCRRLTLWVICA